MYQFLIGEENKGEVMLLLINSPHIGEKNMKATEGGFIFSFKCAIKHETSGFKKIVNQIKKLSK